MKNAIALIVAALFSAGALTAEAAAPVAVPVVVKAKKVKHVKHAKKAPVAKAPVAK